MKFLQRLRQGLLPFLMAATALLPASGRMPSHAWRTLVPAVPDYFPFSIDEDALGGAPDVSNLNRPLYADARVFVRGAHFYRRRADAQPGGPTDERVRLFGASLAFRANFPDQKGADALAKRLRKLGFNAVRLHHLDSLPSDDMQAPLSILSSGPYPSFNPVAMKRLRYLIEALTQQGIYTDLNLHVGYRFRPEIDDLPALDDGATMPPIDAPIHVYDERLIERQIRYMQGLVDGLGLRHNPALALVEIDNETSLLSAWHDGKWNQAIPSAYAPELRQLWGAWLARRYASLSAACDAWGGCDDGPSGALELPDPGHGLSGDAAQRQRDFLEFLAATDRSYFERMRNAVHAATDDQVPVTGTQMSFGGAMNFDSQVAMDYIDEHIYVAHPSYPDGRGDAGRWRTPALSASGDEMYRLLALGQRRDAARPFVVSEYNEPFPNPRGAEMIPLMSILAAQQDWDGLFFFEYSGSEAPPRAPTHFDLAGDWGKYVLAGPSARLFRTAELKVLPGHFDVPLGPADRLNIGMEAGDDALRKYLERHFGATPALAWSGRVADNLAPDAAASAVRLPVSGPGPYTTPGHEVFYDPAAGRLWLSAATVWGVFGAAPTGEIGTSPVWMTWAARSPENAAILVNTLDGADLARSRHLLLSAGTLTMGAVPGGDPERPAQIVPYEGDDRWLTLGRTSSGDAQVPRTTQPPTWMLRIPFTLGLSARPGTPRVYPLDGSGRRGAALPSTAIRVTAAGWTIALQQSLSTASPWYEIEFE
jgi:hypothetical protein